MWDSDVDFDLAAFHSLVRALKRRLVQVVKVYGEPGGPLDPLGLPSSFEGPAKTSWFQWVVRDDVGPSLQQKVISLDV
jgi:hypothetical protein